MSPHQHFRGAYKLKVAATLYSVSVTSLRRAITEGRLVACREFRHIIVTAQALDDFFNPKPASKHRREGPG